MRRGNKRKGIEAQRAKHPTPSRATDALIGDEEQNVRKESTHRGRNTQPHPGDDDGRMNLK